MSEKIFKVGDVICDEIDNLKGVVTRINEDDNMYILWSDGSCGWHGLGLSIKKTGMFLDIERHILSRLRSYK